LLLVTTAVALAPDVSRGLARRAALRDLAAASGASGQAGGLGPAPSGGVFLPLGRASGTTLASWQTVGGCGAGAASGTGAGVKWIGRGVSGGLFNVQCQANYAPLFTTPKRPEHQLFLNTLVTASVTEKVVLGANVPFVYKYLVDPDVNRVDISNGGLGDASVQGTYKLGPINATSVTAVLGLPSGVYDAKKYGTTYLRQHQQTGFGRVTGSLMVDHTMDEIWGVVVLGGVAAYRGGENRLGNYRAPSATGYAYAGRFVGPFVPAVGLALTGFAGHDRDRTEEERTALVSVAPSLSIEWATEYFALLLGGTIPYQYDGFDKDSEGRPRTPHGFGPWMVALGISVAPF
jgi:hypothetical protein